MNEPLVSIVIPCYNSERFIGFTLAHARNQTYQNLEIIVVDDCSTDKSVEVIEQYKWLDPRIRMLSTGRNSGAGKARNLGIEASHGKYIAPVDADDLCMPTKIERMVEVFEAGEFNIGCVYTWSSHIDEYGNLLSSANEGDKEGFVLEDLVRGSFVGNGSCVMFKRSVLEKTGLYNTALTNSEDTDLYIRIAEQRYRFAVIPEHLTAYRKFSTSKSSNTEKLARAKAQILKRVKERQPELPNSLFRESEAILYQYLAGKTKENNQHGLTAKWLFLAMRADPSLLMKRHLVKELVRSSLKKLLGGSL